MAAQGAADVAITIVPPLAPHNQQGQTSPSSSAHGNSFVRSIDRKARSYLKTFERSLSFSTGESRDEDTSSMTIEFLKTRLQAQRAEYKAEKQKAQQLARKVLELEQRLNTEIERRRKAENHDILLSPRYSNKLRSFRSYNDRMEFAKFRETSSGEEHSDCCSEISGSEDGIFFISPSSLRHRLEISSQERQRVTTKDINEASVTDKESRAVDDEEPSKKMYGGSKSELYGPKGSEDFDNTDMWHTTDSMDPQPSKITNTFDNSGSEHEEPLVAEQLVVQNQPYVQPCTFYEMVNKTKSEKTHYINATKEMAPQSINYHVKPMFSCQNCQQPIPQNHTRPADRMINDNMSPCKEVYVLDSQTPLEAEKTSDFGATVKPGFFKGIEQNQIHKYTLAQSSTNKDETEEGPTLNQVTNGEYVKAILPLDVIKTLEDCEISLLRLNSEKLPYPCKKANPNPYNFVSPLQTRQRGRLYRMSLDGGMDRLQEIRHKDRQRSSRQSMS